MTNKAAHKKLPKLSDTDRHKRFVEMARELDASEDPKALDRALKKISKNTEKPKN